MLAVDSSIITTRSLAPIGPAVSKFERSMGQAAVRRVVSKEHVFSEGDQRRQVFRIEEGVVSIYKTLSDGRRQIVDFAYPGDLIGLGTLPEHVLSAQATCDSKVRCLSAAMLEREAESDPELALKLYKSVSQELAATRDLLVSLGQRSAIERVALFLLNLSRKAAAQDGPAVHLTMLRSDIADLLGLTIETVSRSLTKLRTMGVIDLAQGGTVVKLNDVARLSRLANA